MREFNTYKEIGDAHQKDLSEFPIAYLLFDTSEEVLNSKLAQLGATSLEDCV